MTRRSANGGVGACTPRFLRRGFSLVWAPFARKCESHLTARASQPYNIYGSGNISCGKWLSQEENRTLAEYNLSWVLGFVSGAGATSSKGQIKTDSDGVSLWMDQYCTKHPIEPVADAAWQLVLTVTVK